MPLARQIRVCPRKGGTHWRHLVNTNKRSVCGGDAVLHQIILTTYGHTDLRRLVGWLVGWLFTRVSDGETGVWIEELGRCTTPVLTNRIHGCLSSLSVNTGRVDEPFCRPMNTAVDAYSMHRPLRSHYVT